MSPLFRLRQLAWDLRANLLFRPMWILGLLALGAAILPSAEAQLRDTSATYAAFHRWLNLEPGAAQVVLGTLAGSLMTVVSVVYSILLVALSLASMQFSTRILAGFMRDRTSQNTLGLLLGSFVWSLLTLRAVHLDPPFVPSVSVSVAIGLAVSSLLALVWFIHHIVTSIQANHLIDRLATQTEPAIDEIYPAGPPAPATPCPPVPEGAATVAATASGYVQLVDLPGLQALAASAGASLHLLRPMGRFVPAGGALFAVHPPAACTEALAQACRQAVDLGPVRTMQQDAEWGFRQIVDIALKALSPAVNDPSTAATCTDHLSRLLIRVAQRQPPQQVWPAGAGRVVAPQPTLADLLDLSIEQIRQYARADMAVSLRLLRALHDVAQVTRDPAALARVALHARLIEAAATASFPAEDRDELHRRLAQIQEVL